jgi:hypothetical protein
MTFTITSPRLIAGIQISDLCPQIAIEGGVGGGAPTIVFPTTISTPVSNTEFTSSRKLYSSANYVQHVLRHDCRLKQPNLTFNLKN